MTHSVKCQQCNNKTTDPSGYCHLHQSGNSGASNESISKMASSEIPSAEQSAKPSGKPQGPVPREITTEMVSPKTGEIRRSTVRADPGCPTLEEIEEGVGAPSRPGLYGDSTYNPNGPYGDDNYVPISRIAKHYANTDSEAEVEHGDDYSTTISVPYDEAEGYTYNVSFESKRASIWSSSTITDPDGQEVWTSEERGGDEFESYEDAISFIEESVEEQPGTEETEIEQ